jgi:hypothetical protein
MLMMVRNIIAPAACRRHVRKRNKEKYPGMQAHTCFSQ